MSEQRLITPPTHEGWSSFSYSLSLDSGYGRIRVHAPNYSAVIELELFLLTGCERWEEIFGKWNTIINALPSIQLPKLNEVSSWNAIAKQTAMPFWFDKLGYVRL